MTMASLDRERLAAVYERNADVLYRVALAQLQNREDAEDAVHDAFSKFYRKIFSFTDEEHERAWFIRVTLNCCHDIRRKRMYRNHASLDEAIEIPDRESHDATGGIEDIMDTVSRLPEKYRAAVVLHYLEDMPVDTAAKALGISESAMKMRLMRARELMRKSLGKE